MVQSFGFSPSLKWIFLSFFLIFYQIFNFIFPFINTGTSVSLTSYLYVWNIARFYYSIEVKLFINVIPTQKTSILSLKQKDQRSLQSHEHQLQIYRHRRQYQSTHLDTSSLAPRKPQSVPKPTVSGIFKTNK
jgi:hypothetical protein